MKMVGNIANTTMIPTIKPALPLSPTFVNISGNQKGPIRLISLLTSPYPPPRIETEHVPMNPQVLLTKLIKTPILAACS